MVWLFLVEVEVVLVDLGVLVNLWFEEFQLVVVVVVRGEDPLAESDELTMGTDWIINLYFNKSSLHLSTDS